ncbi:cytochrome c oxidase accessory protein CcoG [Hyphococcus sp.]|uniref:cytochrome c oxidase accessory protein CcoG n=1 Tax=Hyphococcus sp. TaxID=2038636 RepID=UPI0035C6E58E
MSVNEPAPSSDLSGGVVRHNVEAVNAAGTRTLYKAREPIYPKRVKGTYRNLKWIIMALTLGVYYFVPWIRWPRGPGEPDQAVLVDFAGRRFYFFFIEIWPDQLYFLTGVLIIAALSLFLATALFGRVWCGYSCPQTVWTDLYVWVERKIEGDRNARMKLAKAKWTADKIRKRVTKHAIWILIGMATGGAWILYFHDAPSLARDFFSGDAPFTSYFFFALLTLTTYLFAGSMREQVCTYMCPWPRIQAALTDEETLEVTYKVDRGEPRGPHKKGDTWEGRGDCVSCRACVISCPMGIDIREGAQLECINCALCIDACDDIMKKVGRPTGLIAYDTDANIVRRQKGETPTVKLFRPRTILYGSVLAFVCALMIYGLSTQATMVVNVLRDRAPPFILMSDGSIRNAYTVKIVNRENYTRDLKITVEGPDGMTVGAVGEEAEGATVTLDAPGDTVRSVRIFATMPPGAAKGASVPVIVRVLDPDTGEEVLNPTVFMAGRE